MFYFNIFVLVECGQSGPCARPPCYNGGTCVSMATNGTTSGDLDYFCACPTGYSGQRCEFTAKCDSRRCLNGGRCQLKTNLYQICDCSAYQTGPHCEIDKGNSTFIPMLTGKSFVERPPIGELAIHFRIEIWFLATRPNGVLFLAASQSYGGGSFVTINLADGYAQAHVRHNSWVQQIFSQERIPLNVWTRLVLLRQKKDELILSINGRRSRTHLGRFVGSTVNYAKKVKGPRLKKNRKKVKNLLRSRSLVDVEKEESGRVVGMSHASQQKGSLPNTPLQLPLPYFIGGFRHFYDVPAESNVLHHFEGAIQKVVIDDDAITDILAGSLAVGDGIRQFVGPPCTGNPCMNGGKCSPQLSDFRCSCPSGKVGDLCELDRNELEKRLQSGGHENVAVRFNGSTVLRFFTGIKRRERQQDSNKIRFKLKTLARDATLVLIRKSISSTSDYLAIAIYDGFIEVSFNLGSGVTTSLRSNRRINDGSWHTVCVPVFFLFHFCLIQNIFF